MASSLGFYSNRPSFLHNAAVPPPPDHVTDNFTLSDTTSINPFLFHSSSHQFSSFNTTNLPFQNTLKYPTLSSSSYNPFISLPPFSYPTDHDQFYQNPLIPNVWMDQYFQSQLSPLPEFYHGGGDGSAFMLPPENYGVGCNVLSQGDQERNGGEVKKKNGNGLLAQSMAARVRRKKISEKTLELGKLIPGGHRMNTAEMFQAAFKYVKFMQAQVGVLQLIQASPEQEPMGELEALVTCPSVQEKLYAAEKCIVTQRLENTLANDQGIIKN